jgi:hypothetical protein
MLARVTEKRCEVADIPIVALPCQDEEETPGASDAALFQPGSAQAIQVCTKLEAFSTFLQPLALYAFHVERRVALQHPDGDEGTNTAQVESGKSEIHCAKCVCDVSQPGLGLSNARLTARCSGSVV